MSRRCVAVSPHLDDAVLSAGATLAHLVAGGWHVRLVTVFTASVPDPQGFALACQTDKGLAAEVDYLALRRDEDLAAAAALGVADVVHLPLAEAPHRGYDSPAALFAGVHADDAPTAAAVADAVAPHVEHADLVLGPQGLGDHVDHLLVVRALAGLPTAPRTAWWRDTPYVVREPGAAPSADLPQGLDDVAVDVAAHLEGKVRAGACYATQLDFQVGGVHRLDGVLHDLAAAEGTAAGTHRASERFLVPTPLAPLLR